MGYFNNPYNSRCIGIVLRGADLPRLAVVLPKGPGSWNESNEPVLLKGTFFVWEKQLLPSFFLGRVLICVLGSVRFPG